MSGPELLKLLESTKMPVVYRAFPEGDAPPLPWLVYLDMGTSNFHADGVVYQKENLWRVELYTEIKDFETEERLETVLTSAGVPWEKSPTVWIESERLYEIIYELGV